jgi:hypothetical protein
LRGSALRQSRRGASAAGAGGRLALFFRVWSGKRAEAFQEGVAAVLGNIAEQPFLRALNPAERSTQGAPSGGGDGDRVCALVPLRPASAQEIALDQTADHVGQGAAVDAGTVHEIGLGQALVFLYGQEDDKLARGEPACPDLLVEDFQRPLLRAPQEMNG